MTRKIDKRACRKLAMPELEFNLNEGVLHVRTDTPDQMDFFLFMLCTSFPFRDENKKEELPRILLIHDSSSYARHPIRARVLVLRQSPVSDPKPAPLLHRAGDTAIAAR